MAYIKYFIDNSDKFGFAEIRNFDQQILLERDREVFIIITKKEKGLDEEYIEGRVTGGSGNIDGSSAVRRTCSGITLVSEQTNIHDYSWALKTEIKIYIGIRNLLTQNLQSDSGVISIDNILYFDMGTYALSSFSISQSVNSCNINISGKDKMCLLNGEMGGLFMVDTELDKDIDGNVIPLYKIVEGLLGLAGIKDYNIDALKETPGKELLEYRGDSPLYLLMSPEENENNENYYKVDNLTIFGDQQVEEESTVLSNLTYGIDPIAQNVNNSTHIQKVEYGEVAGYRWCDLIYPGSLTAAAGESIASILEKIKNVLGAYEYYFDVDGKFWFKKQTASLSIQVDDYNKIIGSVNSEELPQYEFKDLSLFTSLSNSPALSNFKNDYIIRGNRSSVSGENKIPIHARYSIIEWPQMTEEDEEYVEDIYVDKIASHEYQAAYCELIYQWALAAAKEEVPEGQQPTFWENEVRKPYRTFTSDLLAFWRDIYNPDAVANPVETTHDAVGDYEPKAWYGVEEINSDSIDNYSINSIFVETQDGYCKYYDRYINLLQYKDIYKEEGKRFISVYDWLNYTDMTLYVDQGDSIPEVLNINEQDKIYIQNLDKNSSYIPYLQYVNVNKLLENTNADTFPKEIEKYGLWVHLGAGQYKKISVLSLDANGFIAPESLSVENFWKTSFQDTNQKLYFKIVGSDKIEQVKQHFFFVKQPRAIDYPGMKLFMQVDETVTTESGQSINRIAYKPLVSWALENNKFYKNQLYVKGTTKNEETIYTSLLDLMELDKTSQLYYCVNEEAEEENKEYELITPNYNDTNRLFVFKMEGELKSCAKEDLQLFYYKCKADGSINNTIEYYYFPPCFYVESDYYLPGENYAGWKKAYIEDPSLMPYELILIDPNRGGNQLLKEYTIIQAGDRQKVSNDNSVTAVRFNEIPLVYFKKEDGTSEGFQMPEDTEHLFVISSQGRSAQDAAAELLYNFTYCTETVSASILPLYNLEPNKRISISYGEDKKETYIVSRINFSLTYNGMMNLTLIRDPITRLKESSNL